MKLTIIILGILFLISCHDIKNTENPALNYVSVKINGDNLLTIEKNNKNYSLNNYHIQKDLSIKKEWSQDIDSKPLTISEINNTELLVLNQGPNDFYTQLVNLQTGQVTFSFPLSHINIKLLKEGYYIDILKDTFNIYKEKSNIKTFENATYLYHQNNEIYFLIKDEKQTKLISYNFINNKNTSNIILDSTINPIRDISNNLTRVMNEGIIVQSGNIGEIDNTQFLNFKSKQKEWSIDQKENKKIKYIEIIKNIIVFGSDGIIKAYNLENGEFMWDYKINNSYSMLSFSQMILISFDKDLILINPGTGYHKNIFKTDQIIYDIQKTNNKILLVFGNGFKILNQKTIKI